jgi:UPF0271 protein
VTSRADAVVDVNADMGEAFGRYRMGPDDELIELVTSANVACGFHAGDPRVMDATVAAAARRGVVVGAHVSYPDLAGFGRRHLAVTAEELTTDALYQIGALDALCRRHGTAVRYVKAHGALYNDLVADATLSRALADAVRAYEPGLMVLTLPGSLSATTLADAGLAVRVEAFPDRAYTADGTLVPRRAAGAVLATVEEIADRGVRMALGEPFASRTGSPVTVRADTLCVHSDTAGAVGIARALRRALHDAGVEVRAFV